MYKRYFKIHFVHSNVALIFKNIAWENDMVISFICFKFLTSNIVSEKRYFYWYF